MCAQRSGVMVNLSSGGASKAHRGNAAYDAAKGGIEAFTRALALDLGPYGVRVCTLVPGSIDTKGLPEEERDQARRERAAGARRHPRGPGRTGRLPGLGRRALRDRARSCSRTAACSRSSARRPSTSSRSTSSPALMRRVGADIGGTFTDLILVDDDTGAFTVAKSLTTPDDPSRAVETVLVDAAERHGVAPADVDQVIHGTTLVTNAIIERKGARTALLATAGFRDAVEIGREVRYELYDLELELPRAAGAALPALRRRRSGRWPTASTLQRARRGVRRAARAPSWREAGVEAVAICVPARLRQPGRRAGGARRRAARRAGACGSRSRPRWCRRCASSSARRPRSSTSTCRAAPRSTCASCRHRLARVGFARRVPPDAVGRRHRDAGDRDALPGPAARVGPGGRRARGRAPRRRGRRRRPAVVRHGRHDRQVRGDRRRRAADGQRVRGRPPVPLQEGLAACRSRSA